MDHSVDDLPIFHFGDAHEIARVLREDKTDLLRDLLLAKPHLLTNELKRGGKPHGHLIHLANSQEAVRILVDVGRETGNPIDLQALNADGHTALFNACECGDDKLANALLQAGAAPDFAAPDLPLAAGMRWAWAPRMIRLLTRAGAHPDGPDHGPRARLDPNMETPLFKAARLGNTEAALELLAAGADGARRLRGLTAVAVANFAPHRETAQAIHAWIQANDAKNRIQAIANLPPLAAPRRRAAA